MRKSIKLTERRRTNEGKNRDRIIYIQSDAILSFHESVVDGENRGTLIYFLLATSASNLPYQITVVESAEDIHAKINSSL